MSVRTPRRGPYRPEPATGRPTPHSCLELDHLDVDLLIPILTREHTIWRPGPGRDRLHNLIRRIQDHT
jgi:hypothetical protein